jgi:hypothetical protein
MRGAGFNEAEEGAACCLLTPLFPKENGGWYRDRTCDPYHVKVVLYR